QPGVAHRRAYGTRSPGLDPAAPPRRRPRHRRAETAPLLPPPRRRQRRPHRPTDQAAPRRRLALDRRPDRRVQPPLAPSRPLLTSHPGTVATRTDPSHDITNHPNTPTSPRPTTTHPAQRQPSPAQ